MIPLYAFIYIYIHTHTHLFRLFSVLGYYKILTIIPCAAQ